MTELTYGSGLRLTELLRLRVKDVDPTRFQLIVRAGKGDKDRVTVLPEVLVDRLRVLLEGGTDIRSVQDLLGHQDVATTQI